MNHKKALSQDKKKQTAQSSTGQPDRKTGLAEELFGDHSSPLENDCPRPSLVRAAALSLRDASTTRAPARSIGDVRDSSAKHPGTISGAVEPPGRSLDPTGLQLNLIVTCHQWEYRVPVIKLSMTVITGFPPAHRGQPGQAEHTGPSSVQPHTVQSGAMFEIVIPGPDTRNPVISDFPATGHSVTGNRDVSEQENQAVAGHRLPGQLNAKITTGHLNTNEYSRPGYRQHALSRFGWLVVLGLTAL